VVYYTYSSWQTQERTFLPFQITWKMIYQKRGPNDGLVAVDSQRWTDKLVADNGITKIVQQRDFPIRADHLEQVGWWNLNEIHKAGWWNMKALREKNKHEEIIKNVYLDIANEVQNNLRPHNGRLRRKTTRRREKATA